MLLIDNDANRLIATCFAHWARHLQRRGIDLVYLSRGMVNVIVSAFDARKEMAAWYKHELSVIGEANLTRVFIGAVVWHCHVVVCREMVGLDE